MIETGLYRLNKNDLKSAKEVLLESFLRDPVFEYLLEKKNIKEASIETFQACNVILGLKYGEVYAPSDSLEGVAIWLPPNHTNLSIMDFIRSGFLNILTIPGNTLIENIKIFEKALAYAGYSGKIHSKHAIAPHWYLWMIGIRNKYRGQGYATKLIQPILRICDQEKFPCYLETDNKDNLNIYMHFGFSIVEEGKLPGSDISFWAMMRLIRSDKSE